MMSFQKWNKVCALIALTMVLLGMGLLQSAVADQIYIEEFPNSTANANFSSFDWAACTGDTTTIYEDPYMLGGNVPDEYEAGVSFYALNGTEAGYGATKPKVNWNTFAYTEEFGSMQGWQDLSVSWVQNVADVDNVAQLAVKVGSQWYASSDTFTNSATGVADSGTQTVSGSETKSIALSGVSSWYEIIVDRDDPEVSGDSVGLYLGGTATSLPTGDIVGAGLYVTNSGDSSYKTFRFDNFEISGTAAAVPEPGVLSLLAGLAFLGLLLKRR